MLRWTIIALMGVVGVGALVYGIGATLPVGHTATRAAMLRQPPESVWTVITDVAAYPGWRKDVLTVEELPPRDGRRIWRERGKRDSLTFEAVESAPPNRLVTRIADTGLPFGGTWEYVLEPEDGATRVTITERGEVFNPLFRFVSRYVIGHASTLETYLSELATRFGERYTPHT